MRDEFERRDEARAVVFGPRTLIRSPYIKCPRCGKEQFGVVGIYGDRYSRRCKECLYPRGTEDTADFPLPRLNKKIIYLDQCAISDMMKALNPKTKAHQKGSVRREWLPMFEKLDTLYKLQLVVCPHSSFHHMESCLSQHALSLKRIFEHLAGDTGFEASSTIKNAQLFKHIQSWLSGQEELRVELERRDALCGNADNWSKRLYVRLAISFVFAFEDEIRDDRQRSCAALQDLFSDLQALRETSIRDWYEAEIKGFGPALAQVHSEYLEHRQRVVDNPTIDKLCQLEPPAESRQIGMILDACYNKTREHDGACRLARQYLYEADFSRLHYVRIERLLLGGLMRHIAAGRKKPLNQGMKNDIGMVSTIVPYCDAAFVDSEIHGLLKEGFIRERLGFDTRIFSPANFAEFFAYLDDIKANATQEHLEKVREVYGDQWEKPFVEMFQLDKD